MILFVYNLLLLAGLAATLPWWMWRTWTTEKYREGLRARMGQVPPRLRSIAAAKPVLWLHAVSVGEVLAVSRLVQELETALPAMRVLVSTTTRTGQKLARERFGDDRVFYCPLDLPWAVRAYLDALRPRVLVLAETEFWPNVLSGCFARAIPVAVVNARISDRSWPRYRKARWFWQPLLSRLSVALAQSETDAERLRAMGCVSARVQVSGNLKFDVKATEEADATRLLRSLGVGLEWLVAGSTLDGEEEELLEVWPRIGAQNPQLAMVIAPRHPERFAAVAALLARSGVRWVRRSELSAASQQIQAGTIVLLDTIGELASLYSLAIVAFVGGSLVAAGGHNPLEPAQFAVPIVMGPHYANFRAITDDLRSADALCFATPGELANALISLMNDREAARTMGARARRVFETQAGATARTVQALLEFMQRQQP